MPYVVTPTGPLGFQVSATDLAQALIGLVADFGSLSEAEAFAASMRQIDAKGTHLMDPEEPRAG